LNEIASAIVLARPCATLAVVNRSEGGLPGRVFIPAHCGRRTARR